MRLQRKLPPWADNAAFWRAYYLDMVRRRK